MDPVRVAKGKKATKGRNRLTRKTPVRIRPWPSKGKYVHTAVQDGKHTYESTVAVVPFTLSLSIGFTQTAAVHPGAPGLSCWLNRPNPV